MDSLHNILLQRDFDEPIEIKIIKAYIRNTFNADSEVIVRNRDIIIKVANAALANTLRLKGPEIKKICNTDKRLIFQIT